jgi:hypothetical protein
MITEGYTGLQRCCRAPGRFASLADLRSTGDTFLAFSSSRSLYKLDYFIHEGANVRLESVSYGNFLASVTFDGEAMSSISNGEFSALPPFTRIWRDVRK